MNEKLLHPDFFFCKKENMFGEKKVLTNHTKKVKMTTRLV